MSCHLLIHREFTKHSTLPLTLWPLTCCTHPNCCPHPVCHILCVPCPSSCPRCEVLREGHFRDCGGGSDHFSTVREDARWGLSDRRLRKWEVPINVLRFDRCLSYTVATSFLPHPPSILHLFLCPCPPVSLIPSLSSSSVSLTLCTCRIKHGWLSLSLTEQPWLRERVKEEADTECVNLICRSLSSFP